jgi:hypothetical protein
MLKVRFYTFWKVIGGDYTMGKGEAEKSDVARGKIGA